MCILVDMYGTDGFSRNSQRICCRPGQTICTGPMKEDRRGIHDYKEQMCLTTEMEDGIGLYRVPITCPVAQRRPPVRVHRYIMRRQLHAEPIGQIPGRIHFLNGGHLIKGFITGYDAPVGMPAVEQGMARVRIGDVGRAAVAAEMVKQHHIARFRQKLLIWPGICAVGRRALDAVTGRRHNLPVAYIRPRIINEGSSPAAYRRQKDKRA